MKLPSLDYLFERAIIAFKRFPLTILSAIIGVMITIFLIEFHRDVTNELPYVNVLLSVALGIPLYFCGTIFSEKLKLTWKKSILVKVGITLCLLLVYISLPDSDTTLNTSIPYIRYGFFNVIAHLLVAFIPFLNKGHINGFWNYNKLLFIRFCTSILYSVFIYAGIALALVAIHLLFNIDIHDELYGDLAIISFGLFNTWFFVAGIPNDLKELNEITTYPKGLKIFTQYILLPLLIIYLLILYAYGFKIIAIWKIPKGIVSYLISIVSILGVFTLLLIYPFGHSKENNWIKKFSYLFYYILFPLLILMFVAIFLRVDDYGITINRFAIILLGVWLLTITVYFQFRRENIKFIPMSLAVILLLMSFGPWSIFSISERSQVNRLKKILIENQLIVDGKIVNEVVWEKDSLPRFESKIVDTNEGVLLDSLHNEVKSILDYLDNHHGFASIQPLFKQDLSQLVQDAVAERDYIDEAEIYMETMGMEYRHVYSYNSSYKYYSYNSVTRKGVTNVSDYDYLKELDYYNYKYDHDDGWIETLALENDTIELKANYKEKTLFLSSNNFEHHFDLEKLVNQLRARYGETDKYDISIKELTLLMDNKDINAKFELDLLNLIEENDSVKVNRIGGTLFFKLKP